MDRTNSIHSRSHLLWHHQSEDSDFGDLVNPQSLTVEIKNDQVLDDFKLPPFTTFEEKSDPHEHITVNTQMVTSLFNVRQGQGGSLREYLGHFNKETIKVVHPK